jgi:hypothetical protein
VSPAEEIAAPSRFDNWAIIEIIAETQELRWIIAASLKTARASNRPI